MGNFGGGMCVLLIGFEGVLWGGVVGGGGVGGGEGEGEA